MQSIENTTSLQEGAPADVARDRHLAVLVALGALGRPAMRLLLTLLPLLLPDGCKAAPDLIGLAAGAASGGATANPAVGFVVGVGTSAAADEAVKWYGRSRQHAEQDGPAQRVGAASLGGTGLWHIHHLIPLGNEHGDFEVVWLIPTPLTACKDVLFSVTDGRRPSSPRHLYDANVCGLGPALVVGECRASCTTLGIPAVSSPCFHAPGVVAAVSLFGASGRWLPWRVA